jgi:hypothetical protein
VKVVVPKIAGGAGTITKTSFFLRKTFTYRGKRRSYLRARCPDGSLHFRILRAEFDLEGFPAGGSPSVSGSITRPCKPKG